MKTYRAKVVAVSPKHRQNSLQSPSAGGCMVGYSLGNSAFTSAKMAGMISWIERRFARCRILVGDSIFRIALQIDRGLSETSALAEALHLGRERVDEVHALTAGSSCAFTVARCSELMDHADYAGFYATLEALARDDVRYAGSVRAFSAMFLARRGAVVDEQLALSRRYLSEELAIMACTVRDGHDTFIYPGNLAIAAELSAGMHPAAPRELCAMTTVALDLRPRASPLDVSASAAVTG